MGAAKMAVDVDCAASPAWIEFYEDGKKYLKTARGSFKRPAVFTPDIVFNLVAMGIEKVAIAVLIEAGDWLITATMPDLVRSLSQVMELDLELAQSLLDLGQFEDLCAFGPGNRRDRSRYRTSRIL